MTMKKTALVFGLLLLTACGDNAKPAEQSQTTQAPQQTQPTTQAHTQTDTPTDTAPTPTLGADGKISLDLTKFNTGVAKADTATYAYPFEQNNTAVQNYAKAYQITAQEAQHAMTLSMASPEVLNKVLDEIVGEYLGHSLTDGKAMSLVVYTTDKVNPAEFDYVIADKFGEGLVLPVKVVQASDVKEKPQTTIDTVGDKFKNDEK